MTNVDVDIIFISDFFLGEVRGGAEFCNDALIRLLMPDVRTVGIKSQLITPGLIANHSDKFFVVANFFLLSEEAKKAFADATYVILEHDHKYVKSNNPSLYANFLAPETQIQNKEFYKNALAVLCQSKKHASVVQRNLLIDNIVSLSGNVWTEEQLAILEKNLDTPKTIKHGILHSHNKNKGMPAAIAYCKHKNIEFEFIQEQPFEQFIENIAKIETLIFFPQWLETYNRFSVEGRILGAKLVTNNLIGVAGEDYFHLKGKEMLDFIRENNQNLKERWLTLVRDHTIDYYPSAVLPKITIFCPLYAGEKYIEKFLEDMENQTIFDQCELIIMDANSPENEREYIEKFMKKHKNVIYKRLDYRATVMETENMALDMATGEFFAQTCVDDRHAHNHLEIMAKHLHFTEDVDLVYADCYQTTVANETFEANSSNGAKYEHSLNDFSAENMIKCLPGPMPMWRKSVHEKCGNFNEEMSYAGDWDMFLRMVEAGSKFKKIDTPLGLYYYNEDGLSTSQEHSGPRGKEEASVFFKYKSVFGQANFNRYQNYFSQFIGDPHEQSA